MASRATYSECCIGVNVLWGGIKVSSRKEGGNEMALQSGSDDVAQSPADKTGDGGQHLPRYGCVKRNKPTWELRKPSICRSWIVVEPSPSPIGSCRLLEGVPTPGEPASWVRRTIAIKLEGHPYLVQHVQQTLRLFLVFIKLTDVGCDLFLKL
jgi:hypothetical protein